MIKLILSFGTLSPTYIMIYFFLYQIDLVVKEEEIYTSVKDWVIMNGVKIKN